VIINFIATSVVTILALIGLTAIISFIRAYRRALREMKYARIRIEWASSCVTYKVVPYLNERVLNTVLALASTISMREEHEGEGKRLVQDKVKAVTVVHDNWPRPAATETGE